MSCEYLWAFNTQLWQPTKRQLLLMLSAVCRNEIERINQFRFKEDFKLCLVGRLMIRKCVQLAIKIKWKDICLSRSEKGKPFLGNLLPSGQNFNFNISHQGDYTVLAASSNTNLGIDIMKYVKPNSTDIPSFFKLMKRQFVDSEWTYILSHKTEWKQLEAFYRMWCLKESYVKAKGIGIGTNSAAYMRFDVSDNMWELMGDMNICKGSCLFINGYKQKWSFHEYQLDDKHLATVALENMCSDNIKMIPFTCLTVEELIEDAAEICSVDEKWWDNFQKKEEKK